MQSGKKRRIYEFDILRGLFIVIIIIDHLQFWPSPLKFLTGEGRLWVSAAEGFFLISGLLIGYIRAYRGQNIPLATLSRKLAGRAVMLYVWGVGITLALTAYILLVGQHPLLPKLADAQQLASPLSFVWSVVTTNYFNDWIYFLRLYAIMLLLTPLFLWMLRHSYERVLAIIMLGAYIISFGYPEGGLQWQLLFFGAAFVGYRLEAIADWLRAHPRTKLWATIGLIGSSVVTIVLSYFFVLGWQLVEGPGYTVMSRDTYVAIRAVIDPWFTSNPMAVGRILLAFLWMGGFIMTVHLLRRPILRYLGWLFIPLGERSLSAYCLQALLLPLIVVLIPVSGFEIVNLLITLAVILGFWAILRIPLAQKLLPR